MAQISKHPLREEVLERIYGLLSKTITDSCNSKEAQMLLDDLLSPIEKIMLAKRLAIAVLLSKGYSYQAIQDILKVSRPTIGTVSLFLKYKGNGYRTFVKKVLREQKNKEFWNKVEDLALKSMSYGKGGRGWRYVHQEIKKKRLKEKSEI